MAAAARRVAEGHYELRIASGGPDEIASLADSFNHMAASLEGQERMRREFIANAAHELRTPLTNLQGYLEALRDGVIEPDRAMFESLWDETQRLVRLSSELETLAEGEAGGRAALVELDLGQAVLSAVELARPVARAADLELTVDLPPQVHARADPDQLAQVLGNLLQNALRYTPPGGRIAVATEQRASDVRGVRDQHGPGDPGSGPAAHLRTVLPGREVTGPGPGWRGHRARHRQADRRGLRRVGRRRLGRWPHARLVQPPGMSRRIWRGTGVGQIGTIGSIGYAERISPPDEVTR